jgi:hypothetical protein
MQLKTLFISDEHIGESALPNLSFKPECLVGPERKIALDQMHGSFNAQGAGKCHKEMNMIWHDDEIVDSKLSSLYIGPKNFDEEICHPLGLEQGSTARSTSSYKEGPWTLRTGP